MFVFFIFWLIFLNHFKQIQCIEILILKVASNGNIFKIIFLICFLLFIMLNHPISSFLKFFKSSNFKSFCYDLSIQLLTTFFIIELQIFQMQSTSYSYQQKTFSSGGIQQMTTTSTTSPAILINSGLTDREGAKQVAKRILDTYDRDRNGVIDNIQVVPMIVDAYKSFNRVFSPSRADIESYLKVLDRNGDGRVTIQDLEDLCSKYLTQKI